MASQQFTFNLSLSSPTQNVKNPTTEFFKKVTNAAGIRLVSNDGPNTLIQELALVVRDIERVFNNEDDATTKINNFMRGFRVLIKKEKYLLKALAPTCLKKPALENDGGNIDIPQESLFRIFLKVDELQSETIEIILDSITNIISENDNHTTSLLRQLLNQLRYLPHIKKPDILMNKLIDTIEIAPYSNQLEILDSIPEIVPDSEINATAKELLKMLDGNDDLISGIIDCLNVMHLTGEMREEIKEHILTKLLTGTSSNDIPVFLDFLLNEKSSLSDVNKIRNCLNVVILQRNDTEKTLIFQKLQKSIKCDWLNVIGSFKTHTDHKPIDLVLLFMLHSNGKLKKRNVELTIKKRVKDGLFKCCLLDQLFQKFLPPQLLYDYFNSIIEIGCSLLRSSSNDNRIIDFSHNLFKQLFAHRTINRNHRQEILEALLILISSEQLNINTILEILNDLVDEISKTPNHTIILMRLLEKLDTDLNNIRLIFEILTRLTCSDESLTSFKEELHMIVRKNLSSNKREFKLKGVVAAVVIAKYLATTSSKGSTELEGTAKEASGLLELANVSVRTSNELISFYYDQLATMFVDSRCYDRYFVTWLFDMITTDFQNTYITESLPNDDDYDDIKMSVQYNLNSFDEVDGLLAVNIGELSVRKNDKIHTLSSHFRLVRLLYFRQFNGDLSTIDALLGCGVILPKFNDLDTYSLEQLRSISNCFLHCINWFRELISAFVTQKNEGYRIKILKRLENLQEMEDLYNESLDRAPKKIKTKENPVERKFREIDTDLIKLLKYKLDSDRIRITTKQFNFILCDYNRKLELILHQRNMGLSNFHIIKPLDIITDCKFVLSNLNQNLAVLMKQNDDEESQIAFDLILQTLSLIFSWSGFNHKQNLELLKDLLKNFRNFDTGTQINSLNHLVLELVERLSNLADYCYTINSGITLVKILKSLYNFNPDNTIKKVISKTACKLLQKDWDNAAAIHIDSLIKSYLSDTNVKTICGIVATVQDQVIRLTDKNQHLEILPSIKKTNFYILYRNLWTILNEWLKIEIQSLTNEQHLKLWRRIALTMQALMSIVKQQETKSNLNTFLKKSIAILKFFLSHGIPILEIELKSQPDRVVEIFKTIQTNTRFLHHLCCYSKVIKDGALVTHVPQFRLILESLIYRVKAALVANNCSAAFWMGNLKNRDLKGEDILTQSSIGEDGKDDNDDDEEELVEDDEVLETDESEVYH